MSIFNYLIDGATDSVDDLIGGVTDWWGSDNAFDDLIGGVTDWWGSDKTDGKGLDYSDIISLLGGVGTAQGWFGGDDQKQVGYQGKIPKLTAVRDRVPVNWDSDRRPGANGRQYLSDVVYAQRPDTPTPTVAEAQATAQAQVDGITQRQGFAGGGIVEAMNALRAAPQQGQPPQQQPMPPQQQQPMPSMPSMPPQGQGIAQAGRYLNGPTDGMGDKVNIDAADGEFVVPADAVSHLGNGNSDAGAAQLTAMMDRIRKARTGSSEQGARINPNNFIPA